MENKTGWICPTCGVSVAPTEKVCPLCKAKKDEVITVDLTQPNVSCSSQNFEGQMILS